MKRRALVSQGSLARMLQTAEEARQRKDFQQCIEILENIARLDPANPNIHIDLAGIHGKRHDYAAAERCFEKAIRVAPNKSAVLRGAGYKAVEFGSFELAERYLAQ